MSMPIKIIDPATGIEAEVVGQDEKNALVVATRQLKAYENKVVFFANEEYGVDMNQDATAGGTPEKVHNGEDNILWTGTNIIDNVDWSDGAQNHTPGGSFSIGFDTWSNTGDECQIAKGSNLDLAGYYELTMWIYVNNRWSEGDSVSVYGWDTTTGAQIGDKVYLENYFSYLVYDIWHKITIPLTDLNLLGKTIDSIRFKYENRQGQAANFYIDDIQFEETGSEIKYTITPDIGTWLYVHEFAISIANNTPSTLTDATMPYLSYDDFLGETLSAGIIYQRRDVDGVLFSQNFRNLIEILQLPNTYIYSQGSDGTNTWITIRAIATETLLLKPELNDQLSFSVNDNLSGLLHFRISAGCKKEIRK